MGERQDEFSYRRFAVCLLVAFEIAGTVYAIFWRRPWESDTQRAHRLCEGCGLGPGDVGGLIDNVRHSTLTREENLDLFYGTFEDQADAEACVPCAEAVLDAAGE